MIARQTAPTYAIPKTMLTPITRSQESAARSLRATIFFARPSMESSRDFWTSKPTSPQDAKNWQRCAHSGGKIPLHAQTFANGRWYDSKYVRQEQRPIDPLMDPWQR